MSLHFTAALVTTLTLLALAVVSVRRGSRPYTAPTQHTTDTEVSDPTDTVTPETPHMTGVA